MLSTRMNTEPVRRVGAVTGLVVCVTIGVTSCAEQSQLVPPSDQTRASPFDEPTSSSSPEPEPRVADPVRVKMPRLDIAADLEPLDLDAKDELSPPEYGMAGWYAAGPEPGEPGAAVIAGHVDSKTGPDVFAALGRARPGHRITIDLEDRSAVTFRVTEVDQFAQANFPTRRVYGATDDPELRLITCGGEYDRKVGRYTDNVVVFAELAD